MLALALLTLAACGPHQAPSPAPLAAEVAHNLPDAEGKRVRPEPLAQGVFAPPELHSRTLSNGLEVRVATQDEVPLWSARLYIRAGGYADPPGKEGLAEATMDMLNEGAAGRSAEELSRELTTLASSLNTFADYDGAGVSARGVVRNLKPTLDLLTQVLRSPDFPEDDWELLRKRSIEALRAQADEPNAIALRVFREVLYGDAYRGRPTTEESLLAISTEDMRAWYRDHVRPSQMVVIAGGALDLDTLVPLLEARLGDWKAPEDAAPTPSGAPLLPESEVIYFVDKPGAAQSIVRGGTVVGQRTDDDWFDFAMGNLVLGGAFSARMNMNLREDKGYTYGARCGTAEDVFGPALWYCNASVQTAVTAPALAEMRREVMDILGPRAITPDELAYFQSYEVNGFPAQHELVDTLLGENATVWRYGLPGDWPERFLPGVQAVTTDSANQALRRHLSPDHMLWLVVGDRETVLDELKTLGIPIVELDRDGSRKEN